MIVLNVEKLLKDMGKTKTWLCDQMDISHYNLNKAISGKAKLISYRYLQGFCTVLNCTFDDLLTIVDDDDIDNNNNN